MSSKAEVEKRASRYLHLQKLCRYVPFQQTNRQSGLISARKRLIPGNSKRQCTNVSTPKKCVNGLLSTPPDSVDKTHLYNVPAARVDTLGIVVYVVL